MNFFCTKKHYEEWSSGRDLDRKIFFLLTLPEAVAVGRRMFGPRSKGEMQT